MKREAEENADADKKARDFVDKINEADSVIYQTEKQLSEYGDKISADAKVAIETALSELKDAHAKKDVDAINKALEAINSAWASATQNMDPNAGQENKQEGPQDDKSDVTDVDFEEVK